MQIGQKVILVKGCVDYLRESKAIFTIEFKGEDTYRIVLTKDYSYFRKGNYADVTPDQIRVIRPIRRRHLCN